MSSSSPQLYNVWYIYYDKYKAHVSKFNGHIHLQAQISFGSVQLKKNKTTKINLVFD